MKKITSEPYMHFHRFIFFLLLTVAISGAGAPSRSFGHDVGEPALQKLPIWNQCCSDGDCVPENVQVLGKASDKQLDVQIHGVETYVDKDKFSPVPSNRTWVCYVNPGGAITDDNIRCILHPQKGGTN
jgi:hypothetical protein